MAAVFLDGCARRKAKTLSPTREVGDPVELWKVRSERLTLALALTLKLALALALALTLTLTLSPCGRCARRGSRRRR